MLDNHNIDIKPNVLCIEWIGPFYTVGHWIPDMIEIVGGKNLISQHGEKSRRLLFSEIKEIDPDVIIFMPCGFNLTTTERELKKIFKIYPFGSLKAYKNKKIYTVDAKSYFSKPGPDLIVGIEILVKILHPKIKNTKTAKESFKKVLKN